MSNSFFGEGFPYTNFHNLNMDWIVKIAKDFLDQYTHIENLIEQGKTDIQNLTDTGLTDIQALIDTGLSDLQEKADALEQTLQNWYNQHSEDIAGQLADALTDLNSWYTTHIDSLNTAFQTLLTQYTATMEERAQSAISSIPADYSAFYASFMELHHNVETLIFGVKATTYEHTGFLKANGAFDSDASCHCLTTLPIMCKKDDVFKYKGVGQYSAVSAILYLDGVIVDTLQYNSGGAYTSITIPTGVDSIVFSSFNLVANDIVLDVITPYSTIPDLASKDLIKDEFLFIDEGITIYGHTGFLKADGSFDVDSSCYCLTTKPIYCYPGEKFYYKGAGNASAMSALFYENGIIVGYAQYNSTEAFTEVTIPENVDRVVFSSYAVTTIPGNVFFEVKYKEKYLSDQIPFINYSEFKYITTGFTNNKYLNKNNGNLEDADNSVISGFISIDGLAFIRAGGATAFSAGGCNAYDASQNFVANIVANVNPWGETINIDELLKQYPTTKYLRFCSLFNNNYPLTIYTYAKSDISSYQNYRNILSGKSYYALGDSFTHGDWNNDPNHPNWTSDPTLYDASYPSYKTYPYWISLRNNMKLVNLSGNGYRLVDHVVGQNIYQQVPADADYCTLMIGLNDGTLNKPIGTIDSFDTTTFYGCLNTMLTYYRENRPNLHFGMLVLPNMKTAYREALINASIKYGYPYLDFYTDPQVPAFMAFNDQNRAKEDMDITISASVTSANKVSENNWHPSLEAHKKMSNWVEEFIKKI